MDAGRELDKLVAEKVTGKSFNPEWIHISCNLPHYSTKIQDAWEVVEKLGNWHGFDFILWLEPESNGQWHAGWFEQSHEGPESRASEVAATAPLAICLAALKAVGYDVQREERS